MLNKSKTGASFRKDRAMLMNVPIAYDDNVEFRATHPSLLPNSDKENLGDAGIDRPRIPSRSVLGDHANRDIPGILKNDKNPGSPVNNVRWSDVVRGKT